MMHNSWPMRYRHERARKATCQIVNDNEQAKYNRGSMIIDSNIWCIVLEFWNLTFLAYKSTTDTAVYKIS